MKKLFVAILFGFIFCSHSVHSEFFSQIIDGKYNVNTLFPNGSGSVYHKNGQLRAKWSTQTGSVEAGFYDENGNIVKDGPYRYYYDNGQLSEEGIIKNGKPDGIWKAYYPNGVLQTEITFKNGVSGYGLSKAYYKDGKLALEMNSQDALISNGKVTASAKLYYPNGQLRQEFFMKDNIGDGPEKEYYENGNLKAERMWKNGKMDGISKYYDENGNIDLLITFKEGLKDGIKRTYYKNGKPDTISYFKKDKEDGIFTYYYENGNLESEVTWKNGKRNGVQKAYYENGNIRQISEMVNNETVGVVKTFYPNGSIQQIANLTGISSIGNIGPATSGIIKSYYENGQLQQEVKLKNGQPDGLNKEYYDDGSLRMEIVFDNGNGQGKEYYKSGKIKSEIIYQNGKRNGPVKTYDKQGNLISIQEYKNGQPSTISLTNTRIADGNCITANPPWYSIFLYQGKPYTGCIKHTDNDGQYDVYLLNEGWVEHHEMYRKDKLVSIRKLAQGRMLYLVSFNDNGKISHENTYEYGDKVLNHVKDYYPNGNLRVEQIYEWEDRNGQLSFNRLISKTDYYQDGSVIGQTPIKDFFKNMDRLFQQNWLYIVVIAFFISIIFIKLLPKTSYTVNTLILISCYYIFTKNWYDYYIHPHTGYVLAFLWIIVASFVSVIPRLFMKIYSRDRWFHFFSFVLMVICSFDIISPRGDIRFFISLIISLLSVGTMLFLYPRNLQLIKKYIADKKSKNRSLHK